MREIKFRAWWKQEKVMINDLEAIYPKGKCAGIFGVKTIKGESLWNFEDIELMQFTGLHDSKGKEIWEGDIVLIKSQYETDEPIKCKAKVFFDDGSFRSDFHNAILTEGLLKSLVIFMRTLS
jgi:uncharacterized phage protein (TIGR01671 family)